MSVTPVKPILKVKIEHYLSDKPIITERIRNKEAQRESSFQRLIESMVDAPDIALHRRKRAYVLHLILKAIGTIRCPLGYKISYRKEDFYIDE